MLIDEAKYLYITWFFIISSIHVVITVMDIIQNNLRSQKLSNGLQLIYTANHCAL